MPGEVESPTLAAPRGDALAVITGSRSALFLFAAFAGCARPPGGVVARFSWEDEKPALTQHVFLTARIESRGVILQDTSPRRFSMDETIVFEAVAGGTELVLIAEVRDGPFRNSRALYYGISAPFELRAGERAVLDVVIRAGPPPFDPPAGPNAPDPEKLLLVRTSSSTKLTGEAGAVPPNTGLLVYSGAEVAESAEIGRVPIGTSAGFSLELDVAPPPERVFVAVLGADNLLSDTSTLPGLQASLVHKISLTFHLDGRADHIHKNALIFESRDARPFARQRVEQDEARVLREHDQQLIRAASLPVWHPQLDVGSAPGARFGGAVAADNTRGQLVMFGGRVMMDQNDASPNDDTWVHDGDRWLDRTPVKSPPARSRHAMAYDSARDRTLLFGGDGESAVLDDLWAWDTLRWEQIRIPDDQKRPGPRRKHALVYDARRGVVVLFGGESETGALLADTWEWDGARWREVESNVVAARAEHAMSFDHTSGRVVLFGGRTASGLEQDLWTFDGTTWREVSLADPRRPPARRAGSMAHDRARRRLVLFGGQTDSGPEDDLWELEWEGEAALWRERATRGPLPREQAMMEYSAALGSLVLFGGSGDSTFGDCWRWDGELFIDRTPTPSPSPGPHTHVAVAYDRARDRVVFAGGFLDQRPPSWIWEWDERGWHPLGELPGAPHSFDIAYDAARMRVVLFGGDPSRTFEWDGSAWDEHLTSPQPEPRFDPRLAFDEARGVIVLFGGSPTDGSTWELEGRVWRDLGGVVAPLPRNGHALAYDPASQSVVLFGGVRTTEELLLGDTWRLRNAQWIFQSGSPFLRMGHALVYDHAHERLLMYGGQGYRMGSSILRPTDELRVWDGSAWNVLETVGVHPSERVALSMAYDSRRQRMVVFGGWDGRDENSALDDLSTIDMPLGRKPSIDLAVDLRRRIAAAVALDSLHISAIAGGQGCRDGGPALENGAVLRAWNRTRGEYVELASTEASLDAPALLTAERTTGTDDLFDREGKVHLRIEPRFGTGTHHSNAEVAADRVVLKAIMRIAP